MKRTSTLAATLTALLLFSIVVALVAYGWVYSQAKKSITLQAPLKIELKRGVGSRSLAGQLSKHLPGTSKLGLYANIRLFQKFEKFQAGTYQFSGHVNLDKIAKAMRAGDIHREVLFSFTIPEGFSLPKIAARLQALGLGSKSSFMQLMTSQAFLKKMNIQGAKTLEGFIYPATYSFYEQTSGENILKKMVDTFWKNLPPTYLDKIRQRNLSLVDAVNIASMIELETSVDDERPMVAEVILARLAKRQPLGIDAALIYGIKGYDGDIKTVHLRDRTNPYNNRIYGGLPPTPIGSPSAKSLEAVLSPTSYGYYYYVLLDRKTGRHHFSKTLQEHNRYVRRLVQEERSR